MYHTTYLLLRWRETTSVATTLEIFNEHGSWVVNPYKTSPALRKAFRDLLRRIEPKFEEDPHDAPYGTPIHFASDIFIQASNPGITRQNPPKAPGGSYKARLKTRPSISYRALSDVLQFDSDTSAADEVST
ncbi:MAG: hypothetical protein Q9207_002118 [Kuettlingeria erythrocarpa]